MDSSQLDPKTREDMIRRAWYAHDARWFAAVAAEYGMEVANRLNRAAVRAVGQIEAGRLARALGKQRAESVEEFLEFLGSGLDLYVAAPLMDMDIRKIDERSYEVTVNDCFVHTNIAKAGITDTYECAVWDRVQGYHEALGQSLEDGQLPGATCVRARGEECRRVLTIK